MADTEDHEADEDDGVEVTFTPSYQLEWIQAWLAAGFREGTILERLLIFPAWLIFRVLFVSLFALCEAVV